MQTHPIASLAGLKEELLAIPDRSGSQTMIFGMVVNRTGTEGWSTGDRMWSPVEEAVKGLLVLAAKHGHKVICGQGCPYPILCSFPPFHEGPCAPGPRPPRVTFDVEEAARGELYADWLILTLEQEENAGRGLILGGLGCRRT